MSPDDFKPVKIVLLFLDIASGGKDGLGSVFFFFSLSCVSGMMVALSRLQY